MKKAELEYIFYRMELSRLGKCAQVIGIEMSLPGTYHTEINYVSPKNISWSASYHPANQRCHNCGPSKFYNSRSPRPEYDQAVSRKLEKLKHHHNLTKKKGLIIRTTIKTANIGNLTIKRLELDQRLDSFNKRDS